MPVDAYLVLQTGEIFKGKRFGFTKEIMGELVFTTSMVGCPEALTDTNYFGQIVVHTFPIIGNCGIIPEDFQSDAIHASACVVNQWCDAPSNFRSAGNIDDFFKQQNIAGLCLDTRKITRVIRENGGVNALVCDSPDLTEAKRRELNEYKIVDAVASVSAKARKRIQSQAGRFNVALVDLGVNRNLLSALQAVGCSLDIFPYDSSANEILESKPHGVVVSNGPGNPLDNREITKRLGEIAQSVPVFGVGLGHQLLALSQGGLTAKLPLGHRGANQPVRDEATGRVYITAQNHGYAVSSLPKNAKARLKNVNDGSCEGLEYTNIAAISSQFIPEISGGPDDTSFLLKRFCSMMEEHKANA